MRSPLWITPLCLLAGLGFTRPASAGKPPVEVEVVVDGDGDDGDFFEEEESPKAKVKKDAAAAHDELESTEKVHVKGGDGKNINTQVVNVVVVGEKDTSTAAGNKDTASTAATATAPVTPAIPVVPAVPVAPAPPAAVPAAVVQSKPPVEKSFWDVDPWAEEGQFLASVSAGGYGAGGFIGFAGEGLATNQLGIRVGLTLAGFDDNTVRFGAFENNFDIFTGGVWANNREINPGNVEQGIAYLGDLSLVFHVLEKSTFDPYVAAGLAHYGYEIAFEDGTDRGGAGYTRLGAGFNVHFSRFFAGVDFGWYPYELYRFALVERGPELENRRSRHHDDFEAVSQPIEDRFVPERYVLAAQVGLRF